VNVTPDSFSDGGRYHDTAAAVRHGVELAAEGADIIDIGGQSTRPHADMVSASEESDRVLGVIEGLCDIGVPLSIDTTESTVAKAAVAAGAIIVNDISGGLFDDNMVNTVAELGVGYVLGHVRGRSLAQVHEQIASPPTLGEVESELAQRILSLPPSVRTRVIVDPGLGFGKPTSLNLELTRNSARLEVALQCPIMIGSSRKRFLGELTDRLVDERDDASVGAALAAMWAGARFVRVHAVRSVRDAMVAFFASMRISDELHRRLSDRGEHGRSRRWPARYLARLLPDLSNVAHHQGHPSRPDADRYCSDWVGILCRRALRHGDGVVVAR